MFMCNLFDIIYLYNDLKSWLPFSYAMAAVFPSTHMLVSSAFGQLSFTKQSCLKMSMCPRLHLWYPGGTVCQNYILYHIL